MRITSLLAASALSLAATAPVLAESFDKKIDHHGMKASEPSIVEIAVGDDTFSTLVAALQTAELVDALSGDGPFTVFAPTNDAFAALGADTINGLLQEENRGTLTSILTYHVVAGEFFARDLDAGSYELTTLQGDTLDLVVDSHGAVTVDGASVIAADVDASNGVVHVIDAVITPGL